MKKYSLEIFLLSVLVGVVGYIVYLWNNSPLYDGIPLY